MLLLLLSCASLPQAEPDIPFLPKFECTTLKRAAEKEVSACLGFCSEGDDACARENCFVHDINAWKAKRALCEHHYPVLYYPNPPWPTQGKVSKEDEEF